MTGIAREELVPRETEAALHGYADLLERWNKKINLVSRADIGDLWRRHILDSAQLVPLAPPAARSWLDLGSGAGFPALVCAAILSTRSAETRFTLVEADARKAVFLREAARCMKLEATIINRRVEEVALPPQDVISARALAPLERLLEYSAPFIHAGTVLLFPKGKQADSELTLARRAWHIRVVRVPSLTNPDATILRLSEVSPRR